ncbi:MAG: VacJ family lipoprotein [Steroidobacterales bacterium]
MRVAALLACGGLCLVVAGCATPPRDPDALVSFRANNDPLEPLNRKIFAFNMAIDRAVLKPVAKTYVRVIPAAGRTGIRNVLNNLHEPVVLANNLLQGEFRRAGTTAGRFMVNTTVGLGGLFDIAGPRGLPSQTGDFGQTLYVWGFHEGPYLMLPLFGPSNPRDGIGTGADIFMDPWIYLTSRIEYQSTIAFSRAVLGGIDLRSRNIDSLDEIEREAVDFYASIRSLYRQNRAADLRHGGPPPTLEDIYDDPASDPGSSRR